MSDHVEVHLGWRAIRVATGSTVAAALANAGVQVLRRSVTGELRGPLCAMGICQECRMTIDGVAHRRACMTIVADGMRLELGPVDD